MSLLTKDFLIASAKGEVWKARLVTAIIENASAMLEYETVALNIARTADESG